MTSVLLFDLIVALVAAQLIGLSVYSRINVARRLADGAVNVDSSGVATANILLRCGWILCMLGEVHGLGRTFDPTMGYIAAGFTLIALVLRILAMQRLGQRWTLPTVVRPGEAPERGGIYSVFRHPNWVGVLIEIPAIPLIHGAWMTAVLFALLEALLLYRRCAVEEAALAGAQHSAPDRFRFGIGSDRRVAIVGAGASGLAAAKAMLDAGIAITVFERRPDVGGLWQADSASGVAQNTHLVSPKTAQAFSDMKMPSAYPTYPRHDLVLQYLREYAQSRGLRDHIVHGRELREAKRDGSSWLLTFADGASQRFSHVIIATGSHNEPRMPAFEGSFAGEIIHSKDYAGPATVAGKRVLVIGAGQSAMDVLCDAAAVAKSVYHSTRRGFICTPRYLMGQPTEAMLDSPAPILGFFLARMPLNWMFWIIASISGAVLGISGTTNRKLGIPRYRIGKNPPPPTMDQRIYNFYAIGDISHRGAVASVNGKNVDFKSGAREEIDLIVCSTGYAADFPYLERRLWPTESGGRPLLRRQIFHRDDSTLFFVGLIHPIGAHWRVFEWQAQLIATYLSSTDERRHAFDLLTRGELSLAATAADKQAKVVPMVNKLAYRLALRSDQRALWPG